MTNAPGVDETSVLAPAMIDAVIAKVDPAHFHALLEALPLQARDAWALGRSWPLPPAFRTPSRVVLLGLGGSAAGGDVLTAIAAVAASMFNVGPGLGGLGRWIITADYRLWRNGCCAAT